MGKPNPSNHFAVQGVLLAGMPVPFVLAYLNAQGALPPLWRLAAALGGRLFRVSAVRLC